LRFRVNYRSYAQYDAAVIACPKCESLELSRLINAVAVRKPGRDYRQMSSGEMLSVLESGDERQAREMFKQVGAGSAPGDASLRQSDQRKGSQPASGSD